MGLSPSKDSYAWQSSGLFLNYGHQNAWYQSKCSPWLFRLLPRSSVNLMLLMSICSLLRSWIGEFSNFKATVSIRRGWHFMMLRLLYCHLAIDFEVVSHCHLCNAIIFMCFISSVSPRQLCMIVDVKQDVWHSVGHNFNLTDSLIIVCLQSKPEAEYLQRLFGQAGNMIGQRSEQRYRWDSLVSHWQ